MYPYLLVRVRSAFLTEVTEVPFVTLNQLLRTDSALGTLEDLSLSNRCLAWISIWNNQLFFVDEFGARILLGVLGLSFGFQLVIPILRPVRV